MMVQQWEVWCAGKWVLCFLCSCNLHWGPEEGCGGGGTLCYGRPRHPLSVCLPNGAMYGSVLFCMLLIHSVFHHSSHTRNNLLTEEETNGDVMLKANWYTFCVSVQMFQNYMYWDGLYSVFQVIQLWKLMSEHRMVWCCSAVFKPNQATSCCINGQWTENTTMYCSN